MILCDDCKAQVFNGHRYEAAIIKSDGTPSKVADLCLLCWSERQARIASRIPPANGDATVEMLVAEPPF